MARAEQTRERIVTGAEEVVLRDGVARLTLEAAAAEAGVSKGGVLYHFPTRDALVCAMVERLVASFDRALADLGADEPGRGAFTRAYLRATLSSFPAEPAHREERLGAAVLAAVAAEPRLLAALQEGFSRWQARIEDDGLEPARATALRLAADGLWLADLLGFSFLRPDLRAALAVEFDRLLS